MQKAAAVDAEAEDGSSGYPLHHLQSGIGSMKIVGVFYKGNEYASKNPDFVGCVENALGIHDWLESQGHQYIVTDDKEGPDCELEKHMADFDVLITTPFHPAYVTAKRINKAHFNGNVNAAVKRLHGKGQEIRMKCASWSMKLCRTDPLNTMSY